MGARRNSHSSIARLDAADVACEETMTCLLLPPDVLVAASNCSCRCAAVRTGLAAMRTQVGRITSVVCFRSNFRPRRREDLTQRVDWSPAQGDAAAGQLTLGAPRRAGLRRSAVWPADWSIPTARAVCRHAEHAAASHPSLPVQLAL
eukprot:SAG31_NODE_9161_length_1324_cov_0.920000_1_plen_147_part_00